VGANSVIIRAGNAMVAVLFTGNIHSIPDLDGYFLDLVYTGTGWYFNIHPAFPVSLN